MPQAACALPRRAACHDTRRVLHLLTLRPNAPLPPHGRSGAPPVAAHLLSRAAPPNCAARRPARCAFSLTHEAEPPGRPGGAPGAQRSGTRAVSSHPRVRALRKVYLASLASCRHPAASGETQSPRWRRGRRLQAQDPSAVGANARVMGSRRQAAGDNLAGPKASARAFCCKPGQRRSECEARPDALLTRRAAAGPCFQN